MAKKHKVPTAAEIAETERELDQSGKRATKLANMRGSKMSERLADMKDEDFGPNFRHLERFGIDPKTQADMAQTLVEFGRFLHDEAFPPTSDRKEAQLKQENKEIAEQYGVPVAAANIAGRKQVVDPLKLFRDNLTLLSSLYGGAVGGAGGAIAADGLKTVAGKIDETLSKALKESSSNLTDKMIATASQHNFLDDAAAKKFASDPAKLKEVLNKSEYVKNLRLNELKAKQLNLGRTFLGRFQKFAKGAPGVLKLLPKLGAAAGAIGFPLASMAAEAATMETAGGEIPEGLTPEQQMAEQEMTLESLRQLGNGTDVDPTMR